MTSCQFCLTQRSVSLLLRTTLQDKERERCRLFSFSLFRNSRYPSRRHFSLVMNPPTSSGCSREPLAKQGESPKEGAWLDKVGSFHSFLELRFGVSLASYVGRPSGKPFAHLGLPSLFGGRRRRRLCRRWWWSQATRASPPAEEREREGGPLCQEGRKERRRGHRHRCLLAWRWWVASLALALVGWRLLEE